MCDKSTRRPRDEGMNHLIVKMHEMSSYEMCTRIPDILVQEVSYRSHEMY